MMNQKILGMALIVGLALSGCGGNGGGGGNPGADMNVLPPSDVPTDVANSGNVGVTAVANAATSTPGAGSVTQSSNADSGVTRDRMNVEADYDNSGQVTFRGMYDRDGDDNPDVTIGTQDADFVLIEDEEGNKVESDEDICSHCNNRADFSGEKWTGAFLGKRDGSDVLVAGFFTDLQPGDPADTDYISAGVWLSVPEDVRTGQRGAASGDIQFGAFADPSNPFPQAGIMALTGSATYQGDALGIYATEDSSSGAVGAGLLFADVELTANFGNAGGLGTVGGTVTNFVLREGGDAESLDPEYQNFVLTLAQTDIGNMEGGFFTGDTSGTDHNGATYSGKWGGMFAGEAGDNPTSVGGTFGAATTSGPVAVNFIGAFGAYEQP